MFITFTIQAQDNNSIKKDLDSTSQFKNELKFNISKSLIIKGVGMAYERLLNENSSIGLELFISMRKKESFEEIYLDFFDSNRTFTLDTYYRRFFSKGYAKGFFLEGFSSLNQANEVIETVEVVDPNPDNTVIKSNKTITTKTDLGIGLSLGVKFVIETRIVAEVHCGVGVNLLGNRDSEAIPRGGISLGYRF